MQKSIFSIENMLTLYNICKIMELDACYSLSIGGFMPRKRREKSPIGLYHIVLRGMNQQVLFESNADFERMISHINKAKNLVPFELHAYCLMSNHVHLLIEAEYEDVPMMVHNIKTTYARKYNIKVSRTGSLFESRYGSKAIYTLRQYRNTVRYIHQNPFKAKIIYIEELHKYKWSSMMAFHNKESELILESTINRVLEQFTNDDFYEFHLYVTEEDAFEYYFQRLSDQDAQNVIMKVLEGRIEHLKDLQKMDIKERNEILIEIKQLGLPANQIARLTGLGRNTIQRAKK